MTPQDELLAIVRGFHDQSYFTFGEISQRRQQSAVQSHGVDRNDTVLAILDATMLGFTQGGSAENGMSITLRGIFWKNMWATRTRRNSYTWEELVPLRNKIEAARGDVCFEPDVRFAATGFKAGQVINLLRALIDFFVECRGQMAGSAGAHGAADAAARAAPAASPPAIAPPPAEYTTALANALALVACSGVGVDDAALELALDLIRSDEFVPDHPAAVDRFSAAVEALASDGAKSSVSFKLRVGKLLAEIRPVADGHLRERVATMVEGAAEALPADRREAATAVIAKVAAALAPPA
jgi:hypothetical protein